MKLTTPHIRRWVRVVKAVSMSSENEVTIEKALYKQRQELLLDADRPLIALS